MIILWWVISQIAFEDLWDLMTLCATGHRLSLPSSCLRPLIQNVKNFLSAKNGWAYLSWHYVCDTIDREYNINTLVEFASHTIIIMTVILLYVCVTRASCFKEDFWARERNRDFWDTWGETTLVTKQVIDGNTLS